MRIVVAPDKFKGTLTAAGAARAMADGVRAALPDATVTATPLGDGGEGSLDLLVTALGGSARPVSATDPLGRPIEASIGLLPDRRMWVESASAAGLGLLETPEPLLAGSRGVGELILHASSWSPRDSLIVGVGGTASTDGGAGAARAAGWRFLDAAGKELPPGGGALVDLASIDGTDAADLGAGSLIIGACDVANPLTGERGAARAFAPQKGASAGAVDLLEVALERLADVVHRDLGVDVSTMAHGGAGGGLGAGLVAFFGARLRSGFELISEALGLPLLIENADLVITGEGRVDRSTLEGKVVGEVARLARAAGTDCVVVAGEIDASADFREPLGVKSVIELAARCGRERAQRDAAACIATEVAALLQV